MTLNQYLPMAELQNVLNERQLNNLEFILKSFNVDLQTQILADRKILGEIHHSVKIDQYKNYLMRRKLLVHTPPQIRKQYFLKQNYPDPTNMHDETLEIEIKKISNFIWGNNEETKNFIGCFGYPKYLIPTGSYEEKAEEIIYGTNPDFYEPLRLLFDYQTKIVIKALKKLEIPSMRFLIQMPTGTGKTRTAMDILARYANENPDCQIIWLAHSPELLSQATDSFKHIWSHVGKFKISMYRIWGNNQIPKIKPKKSIIFAGDRKLENYLKKGNALEPNLIVIDEAHKILANEYNELLHNLSSDVKSTKVFGLTATPGRGIDEKQNDLLAKEFNNNLINIELDDEDKCNYENDVIEYLQDSNILATAEYRPLRTNFEYNLTSEEWKKLTQKLHRGDYIEYDDNMLQKLAEDNKRTILIIDELKKYVSQGKKILYFSTDLQQSILVAAILTILGIKAIHVDSTTDKSVRKEIIKKFKSGDEIEVICNFNIFSTGFDVPDLDVVFIGRPVNSPVLFNQIVGRGTRGIKMGGQESFILVQVIDKIYAEREFNPYSHYARWDHNWTNYNDN